MKKSIGLLLCSVAIFLSACGSNKNKGTTSVTTTAPVTTEKEEEKVDVIIKLNALIDGEVKEVTIKNGVVELPTESSDTKRDLWDYDEDEKTIIQTKQEFESKWVTKSKVTFNYYSDIDDATLDVDYYLTDDEKVVWIPAACSKFEYDSNGYQSKETVCYWSSIKNDWIEFWKYEFGHDSAGNMTMYAVYGKTRDENWIGKTKRESEYNENGKIIKEKDYSWNSSNKEWFLNMESEEVELDNGKIEGILYSLKSWSSNSSPSHYDSKFVYEIDGTTSIFCSYDWDKNTNSWVLSSKMKEEKDLDENSASNYNWDSNSSTWIFDSKTKSEVEIAPSGIETMINYVWNADTNSWVKDSKTLRKSIPYYGIDSTVTLTAFYDYYLWSTEKNSWIGIEIWEKDYDRYNNQLYSYEYIWSNENGSWMLNKKSYSYYDLVGRGIKGESYTWSTDTNSFVGTGKSETKYCSNGTKDSTDYIWSTETNTWICSERNVTEYNSNIETYTEYIWSTEKDTWVYSYKYVTEYDSNFNIKSETEYVWSTENNDWIIV